ncbi:O-antigen ligase family protein [Alteromonas sp. KUL49]|nr:O-antigen ligase family protein [Alteromonas sp. KUL49]
MCYTLFLLSIWSFKNSWKDRLSHHSIPILCFSLFVLWNLIQIVPLPKSLISIISPNALTFYEHLPGVVSFVTLSIDSGQSLVSLYKGIAYLGLFISVLLLCETDSRIRLLVLAIVMTGVLQALYGSVEVLSGLNRSPVFDLPVKTNATGSFVYKNHFANYLMLCLSMGVGYLIATLSSQSSTSRDKLRTLLSTFLSTKAIVRIGLAIMVIALVMSRSRMGNTAFFTSMTIVGFAAWFLFKNRTRGLSILIISLFVIDMFILSAWFGLDKIKERIETTSLTHETRDEVVRDSLPMLKDYAVTGSGMGSYYSLYPVYQSDEVHLFYDHAHNDYLQFLIEAGSVSSFIILMVPLIAATRCVKAMRKRRNKLIQGVAFGVLMGVIGMLIHISVDFPLQAPANTSLFVTILALGLLTKKSSHKGVDRRREP